MLREPVKDLADVAMAEGNPSLDRVLRHFYDGNWSGFEHDEPTKVELAEIPNYVDVSWYDVAGLNKLIGTKQQPGEFDRLAAQINSKLQFRKETIKHSRIYLTAYPSVFSVGLLADGKHRMCGDILEGLANGRKLSHGELEWARDHILDPLNQALKVKAQSLSWTFIDGHLDKFAGHGVCMSQPYEAKNYPGNPFPGEIEIPLPAVRWGRGAKEVKTIQITKSGTVHPNEFGHRAFADAIFESIKN